MLVRCGLPDYNWILILCVTGRARDTFERALKLHDEELWREACNADQEAVLLYRQLYPTQPDAYRAALAQSLQSLGFHLGKLELWREARDAGEEAVQLHRQLYATDPDLYRGNLVGSLYRLGNSLRHLAEWKYAMEVDADAASLFDITGQVIRSPQSTPEGQGGYGTVFQAEWFKPKSMRFDVEPRQNKVQCSPST